MTDTRQTLIDAARDHDAACYRDLPGAMPAPRRAEIAAREVLEAVARNLGFPTGTTITLVARDTPRVEVPS